MYMCTSRCVLVINYKYMFPNTVHVHEDEDVYMYIVKTPVLVPRLLKTGKHRWQIFDNKSKDKTMDINVQVHVHVHVHACF